MSSTGTKSSNFTLNFGKFIISVYFKLYINIYLRRKVYFQVAGLEFGRHVLVFINILKGTLLYSNISLMHFTTL